MFVGLQGVEGIKEEIAAVAVEVVAVAVEVEGMVTGVAPIPGTSLLFWVFNSNRLIDYLFSCWICLFVKLVSVYEHFSA